MLWNIAVNDAGAEYDPLTLLRTRTMFGRPDWKSIYRRIREAIEIGQYLPGSTAQLKTKVGVSSPPSRLNKIPNPIIDILLRTRRAGQGHQGGDIATH